VSAAARASRERSRMIRTAERRRRIYWTAVARAARLRALLAAMALEIEATLADLDRTEP
jgi:hypothetical protein